ncbi:MAG: hypothetical protein ACOVQA_08470 [Thermoflexibacteraceae bacterium]|jgi:hypothetical protein
MKTKIIFSFIFICLNILVISRQTAYTQTIDSVRYANFATAQSETLKAYEKLLAEIPELNTYLAEVVVKKYGFKLKTTSKQGYHAVYKYKNKKGTQLSKLQVYKRVNLKRQLLMEVQRQHNEITYLKLITYSPALDAVYELSPDKFYKEVRYNSKNAGVKQSYILLNINKL